MAISRARCRAYSFSWVSRSASSFPTPFLILMSSLQESHINLNQRKTAQTPNIPSSPNSPPKIGQRRIANQRVPLHAGHSSKQFFSFYGRKCNSSLTCANPRFLLFSFLLISFLLFLRLRLFGGRIDLCQSGTGKEDAIREFVSFIG